MVFRIRREQLGALRKEKLSSGLIDRYREAKRPAALDRETGDVLVEDARGHKTRYTFDADGFISGMVTPLGRKYSFETTQQGSVTRATNPAGYELAFEYGPRGDLARLLQNSLELCRFEHDDLHRPTTVTYHDRTTTRLSYHGLLTLASVTDRLGHAEAYDYTELGQLRAVTDGNGNRTTFGYAEWDRPVRATYADGSAEEYGYDEAGRVASLRAAGEPFAALGYGEGKKPTRILYGDGREARFEYGEGGRPTKAVNEELAVAYAYDDEGRVTAEDQGGRVVKYAYDPVGNLVALTYPGGGTVRFAYDADRRLASVADWDGGVHSFSYKDGDSGYELHTSGDLYVNVTHSSMGRPTSCAATRGKWGHQVFSQTFEYDVENRLTSARDSELGARAFRYDAEGQLVEVLAKGRVPAESFAYDAAGNRTRCNGEPASFNALNQLVSQGRSACAYDARGNATRCPGRGGEWRLTYNRQNLLVAADGPQGQRLTFGYDAFGRRVRKRVEQGHKVVAETRYLWAGENLIAEESAVDGRTTRREYVYLPGTHTPLLMRADGAVFVYHCDPSGMPTRLTGASGEVAWSAVASAFGQVEVRAGEVYNPLRYPGQYHDAETDLHYNRFRYYSPRLGRYLSRDPLGLLGGTNLYTYVGNGPLNRADPLGLWWKAALSVVAGVAAAAAVVLTAPVSVPALAIAAGAAAMGVGVGLGVNKALNLKELCVPCALKAFGLGFLQGVGFTALTIAAAVTFPAWGTAIAVGGAAIGITLMLGEHFGWWGKSYEEMTPEEQSASLGGLWGNLAGGVVTGVVAGKVAGGRTAQGETGKVAPKEDLSSGGEFSGRDSPNFEPGEVKAAGEEAPAKSFEDILKDTTPGRETKGKTSQHVRPGGMDQANTDFDSMKPTNVKQINTKAGAGRTGTLPDGRSVTVRPGSSDGRPTLEVRNPANGRGHEIRYDD